MEIASGVDLLGMFGLLGLGDFPVQTGQVEMVTIKELRTIPNSCNVITGDHRISGRVGYVVQKDVLQARIMLLDHFADFHEITLTLAHGEELAVEYILLQLVSDELSRILLVCPEDGALHSEASIVFLFHSLDRDLLELFWTPLGYSDLIQEAVGSFEPNDIVIGREENVLSVVNKVQVMFSWWQYLRILNDIQRRLRGFKGFQIAFFFAFLDEIVQAFTFVSFGLELK